MLSCATSCLLLGLLVAQPAPTRALHVDHGAGSVTRAVGEGHCRHEDVAAQHLRGGQGWKLRVGAFVPCGLWSGPSRFGVHRASAAEALSSDQSQSRTAQSKVGLRGGSELPPLGDAPPLSPGPEKPGKGGRRRIQDIWLAEVPKVVRYTVSCAIANLLYFGLYTVLLGFIASAGLCVNLAYLASVVWQHALHRILVYGKNIKLNKLYFKELAGIYMAYGVAFVLNPLITEGCITMGKAHIAQTGATELTSWLHPGAFMAALVVTGAVNFFTVSAVFDKAEKDEKAPVV